MTYFGTRLSENISLREPEGYLLCLNVPVARTGVQEYLPGEVGLPPGPGLIPVHRPPEEVFDPACMASFEGMPVTDDHPADPEGVTAENIRWLQKGHAHNIRRSAEAPDLLLADLIITDSRLIDEIMHGKREISCGYNYTLCQEEGKYVQRGIRGNHIAVVDAGRAGPRVAIRDRRPGIRETRAETREPPKEQNERRMKTMNNVNTMSRPAEGRIARQGLSPRQLAKWMARMARDGETEELAEVMEGRKAFRTEPGRQPVPVLDREGSPRASVAVPILSEGDVLGCVLFLDRGNGARPGEVELKLADTVSRFLGKQMES